MIIINLIIITIKLIKLDSVTVYESLQNEVLVAQWMILHFLSNPQPWPRVPSPLKESLGIDLYTCWLLLTCHSQSMVQHNLAPCSHMCSLTLGTAHLARLETAVHWSSLWKGLAVLKGLNWALFLTKRESPGTPRKYILCSCIIVYNYLWFNILSI